MWKLGRLKAKLQPKQKLCYEILHRAEPEVPFCMINTRSFGKTFTGCAFAIETARQQTEPVNILIISSTLKKLRTIVRPNFLAILRDCPAEYKPSYHAQDGYWEFPNGVRVHLCAAEKGRIEDIRGIHKVVLVLIDEAAFFGDEEDSYPLDYIIEHILNPMFLRTKSKARIVIMTTPPETPNHPVKAIYQEALLRGAAATFDIYNSDIALDKIAEMKRRCKDPLAWEREYLCRWVVDKNRLIIPEWEREYETNIPHDSLFDYWDKYFALDTGSVDKTVGLLSYYKYDEATLIFEDEIVYEGRNWTTDMLAAELRMKERNHWGNSKVYRRVGDTNNQVILADITHLHKMPIIPAVKMGGGIESLQALVNIARMWVKSGRVKVNPRCKLLIQTLHDGIWNKTKDEFAKTTALGHMDALAAFVYAIRNVDEQHNPVPSDYNFKSEDQVLTPAAEGTVGARALRSAFTEGNPFLQVSTNARD